MSFENDITSIKKLFEDNQLFKPASEDDKAERKTYDEQKYIGKLAELRSIIYPKIEQLKKTYKITNVSMRVDDEFENPVFLFDITINGKIVTLSAWKNLNFNEYDFAVNGENFGGSIEFHSSKISKFVAKWADRMSGTEGEHIGESKLNDDNQLFKPASPEDKIDRPKPKTNLRIIFQETVPLIYWQDLTPEEKKEFDYDVADEGTFFRYRDNTYDLCSFIRTNRDGELAELGWQGVSQGTYDSGDVVKDFDNGDEITVAGFYCSSVEEAINEDNLLFKPASNDDREERQAAERARIEPLVRKQINKIKTIIFPKILDGLRSNGKVEDVEVSETFATSQFGTDTFYVFLYLTFRESSIKIAVEALSDYRTYTIEIDGRQVRASKVSNVIQNIIRIARKYDTEDQMPDLRTQSKATKRVTTGSFKNVFDVGRAFINGEVAGGVTHNKNLQASIINDVLYSYATPIAIRKDGTVYAVDKKFSNTTTRLQDTLRGATKISVEEFKEMLTEKGITNFGYLGENNISIKEDNNLFKPASSDDLNGRPKQFQFTGDDIGCYVDCSRGIYVGKRIQELAIEYGWSNDPNANSAVLDPNDESYYDATDEAEEFLNTLCDDTVYFGVNESGDFMLMKRDTE
jgi:hypothetical protein